MSLRNRSLPPLLLVVCLMLSSLSASAQGSPTSIYLPLVARALPPSIFGFEVTSGMMANSQVAAQAGALGSRWVRLNGALWSEVEPVRGAGYNWAALAQLDASINAVRAAGMTPAVVVRGTPSWASINGSGCAAIRDEHIADFANFMAALTERYKNTVSYWEIWNEPDVDSRLVPSDYPYGCWGDIDDPYYGGERYGRMLQAIAPAMRAVSPAVRIIHGGLLLDRPLTTDPAYGRPELFLEGVLRSGAANSFDILAYHAYPYYTTNPTYDYDLDPLELDGRWFVGGGWTLGKAAFLRQIMTAYGVSKPFWLNETALICLEGFGACGPPGDDFYAAKADQLVRVMSRAAAGNIEQVIWYTLDGPGWANAALLDSNQGPRPAYEAYQRMASLVSEYSSVTQVGDYGAQIEAYRFARPGGVVDVLWSRSADIMLARVPLDVYRSAVRWDGATPATVVEGETMLVPVGFQATFIERSQ